MAPKLQVGGKVMKILNNLVLGAALAAVCLLPNAWADTSRLLSGQPLPSPSRHAAIGRIAPAVSLAMTEAYAEIPPLFVAAFERLSGAQSGRH
jgi:hypothetical protein